MKELTTLESSNNKKLLVVLPINKILDKNLNKALFHLREQTYKIDLLILTSKDLTEEEENSLADILRESKVEETHQEKDGKLSTRVVPSKKDLNYVIETTEKNNFQGVFNESFNYALTNGYEWFSVVEYLDAVDFNWYKIFDEFSSKKEGVDVYTPIAKQSVNGFFKGFLNESCWAEGFAEEAGLFDQQMLVRMNCINLTGSVLKTNSIKQYSEEKNGFYYPMKESFNITSSYEFFLRFVYNDIKVFTIPRIGYDYYLNNNVEKYDVFLSKVPANLLQLSKENGGVTQQEYQFWIQAAKKEYFFDEDRSIEYKEMA